MGQLAEGEESLAWGGEACVGQREVGCSLQPLGEKAGAQHEWKRMPVAWIQVVTLGMILEGQSRHLKLKQKAGCKPQIADSSGW